MRPKRRANAPSRREALPDEGQIETRKVMKMKRLLLIAGTAMLALLFTTETHAQRNTAYWGTPGVQYHGTWGKPVPTTQSAVRRKPVPQRARRGRSMR
jgi:hypothetical protein